MTAASACHIYAGEGTADLALRNGLAFSLERTA
jgi:hypothetical protein